MRISVDVDIDEVLADMDSDEIAQLARDEGFTVIAKGQGDDARANHLIDRAYHAARNLPNLPRDIADLFWHVHGRAI